ncbi:hypothetical protein J6590_050321 [Homalodisca vitripennis]|nr:hypothetical protein J6590_050321 [Homalodisca vitripennis]
MSELEQADSAPGGWPQLSIQLYRGLSPAPYSCLLHTRNNKNSQTVLTEQERSPINRTGCLALFVSRVTIGHAYHSIRPFRSVP